jgi:excisionase family DNA binding protein
MPGMKKQAKSAIKQHGFDPVSASVSTRSLVERHFRMAEAARSLGVSRSTLYRWLPQIQHRRIPAAGLMRELILIPESALAAFLALYDHIPEGTHESQTAQKA